MSTLAAVREQLAAYEPATISQIGIKSALEIFVNAEPQLEDSECISGLREDLPPSILYSAEALQGPAMLHRLLRLYLQLKAAVYTQHPDSNRITFGLPSMLYHKAKDCDAAFKSLQSHTTSSSQSSSRQVDQVDGGSRNQNSGDSFFRQDCTQWQPASTWPTTNFPES
jgi:hypothetical protein